MLSRLVKLYFQGVSFNFWLQSPSAVILEPPKIKSATVSTVSPSISHRGEEVKKAKNQHFAAIRVKTDSGKNG